MRRWKEEEEGEGEEDGREGKEEEKEEEGEEREEKEGKEAVVSEVELGKSREDPREAPPQAWSLLVHLVALGPGTLCSSSKSLASPGCWAPPPPRASGGPPSSASGLDGTSAKGDSGAESRRTSRRKADVSLRNAGHDCLGV